MPSPQQFNMGGVTTGSYLFIKTDRPIKVALNDISRIWDLGANNSDGGILLVGTFTAVYLQNTNPTYEATVDIVAVGL